MSDFYYKNHLGVGNPGDTIRRIEALNSWRLPEVATFDGEVGLLRRPLPTESFVPIAESPLLVGLLPNLDMVRLYVYHTMWQGKSLNAHTNHRLISQAVGARNIAEVNGWFDDGLYQRLDKLPCLPLDDDRFIQEFIVECNRGTLNKGTPFTELSEISLDTVATKVRRFKELYPGKKVGIFQGSFDPAHIVHIMNIATYYQYCDLLIVAIDSDGFIARTKGSLRDPSRTAYSAIDRANYLADMSLTDHIVVSPHVEPSLEDFVNLYYQLGVDYVFMSSNDENLAARHKTASEAGATVFYDPLYEILSSSDLFRLSKVGYIDGTYERIAAISSLLLRSEIYPD